MSEPPSKKPAPRRRPPKRAQAADTAVAPALGPQPQPAQQPPAPLSMADRAARYRKPPPAAADLPANSDRPATIDLADRARRLNPHLRADDGPAPASDRPRQVDMAEIAARNRQARFAARDDRRSPGPADDRAPLNLLERAARHRRPLEDEETAPTPAVAPQPAPSADVPSMAERAAEAVRKHRDVREPVVAMPSVVEVAEQATATAGSLAFVWVTRNHAGVLDARLQAWRALLPSAGVRWLALDLGSTDLTVAGLADHQLRVLHLPGGLTTPLLAIDQAARAAQADVALIVDADAEPHPGVLGLVEAVRAGHVAAVAPERRPVAMAVSTARWLAGAQAHDLSVLDRTGRLGGLRRLAAGRQPAGHGVVAQAVERGRWQRLRTAVGEVTALLRALAGR